MMTLSVLFATVSDAQPIASDNFESATVAEGAISSGEGFAGSWKLMAEGKTDLTVVEKSLTYEAGDIKVDGGSRALQYVASEDKIRVLATRELPVQTDTTYLSFLVQPSNSQDGNDFFQFGFDAGKSSSPNASVVMQGKFYPRSNTALGGAPSIGSVKQDQTYLVVLKVEHAENHANYNQVTVFVNPTSLDESANKPAVQKRNSGVSEIKRLLIRKAFTEKSDTFTIDAIRIGKSFESVLK
tara:strand:+ start:1118 stop:1840 length:723 start_codon:yes stop_codon:yes gene_type:complete